MTLLASTESEGPEGTHEITSVLPGAEGIPRSRRSGGRLLASYLLTVLLLVTVNFFLPRALPGDPISALMVSDSPSYVQNDAIRDQLRDYYGLDRPMWAQYRDYLRDLAVGELGVSIRYNVGVRELLAERLPWTLLLIVGAMVPAIVIGWVAAVHSAWQRGRGAVGGLLALFLTVHSFPVFFLGSLALFVFSVKLGWLPLSGTRTPFATHANAIEAAIDVGRHLILPAGVLALQFATSQYVDMRASMVGELGSDYLLGGRAKGLRDRRLKYRYAARNALLPVVAVAAVQASIAVTSSILVETVFAYQGLGRLTFESVAYRDYPTLQGCFLVLSFIVVTANFGADVLNARLDPRTRS